MLTIIAIIITAVVAASLTFTATRSLYIHRFAEWYRQAVDSEDINETARAEGDAMYNTLYNKWHMIREVDNSIIPEYVSQKFDVEGDVFTQCDLRFNCRVARWLGYDLTLTKRDVPPPPPFKPSSPKNIRTELVECIDATLSAEDEQEES